MGVRLWYKHHNGDVGRAHKAKMTYKSVEKGDRSQPQVVHASHITAAYLYIWLWGEKLYYSFTILVIIKQLLDQLQIPEKKNIEHGVLSFLLLFVLNGLSL